MRSFNEWYNEQNQPAGRNLLGFPAATTADKPSLTGSYAAASNPVAAAKSQEIAAQQNIPHDLLGAKDLKGIADELDQLGEVMVRFTPGNIAFSQRANGYAKQLRVIANKLSDDPA
jgi:ABC-type uncharacterized transport system substrate-binding protein